MMIIVKLMNSLIGDLKRHSNKVNKSIGELCFHSSIVIFNRWITYLIDGLKKNTRCQSVMTVSCVFLKFDTDQNGASDFFSKLSAFF